MDNETNNGQAPVGGNPSPESPKPENSNAAPSGSAMPATAPQAPLTPVGQFFREVWRVYREKFWQLAGLVLAPVIILFLPAFFGPGLGFLLGLIGALAAILAQGALIIVLSRRTETIAFRGAYREAWTKFPSILWVAVITAFITTGSFMLLIIPGIIFTVWFMFALVVLLVENNRGMEALLKSREYVKNYFWPVFGRYLVFLIIALVVGGVLSAVMNLFGPDLASGEGPTLGFLVIAGIVQAIIALLLIPFGAVFQVLLFENLKKAKAGQTLVENGGRKTAYLVVALIGWLLAIVLIWIASLFVTGLGGFIVGGGLNNLDLPEMATDTPMSVPPSETMLETPIELQAS